MDGDKTTAADLLVELIAHTKQTVIDPEKYPDWILGERDQDRMIPWVTEALEKYGEDAVHHLMLFTVSYLHGVRSTYFFVPLGSELVAFAPWLGLRMFAMGVWVGQHRAEDGQLPDDAFSWPSEDKYFQDLLEMYGQMELRVVGNDDDVTEVENPFTGDTIEEE
jgi:hypothetical protein